MSYEDMIEASEARWEAAEELLEKIANWEDEEDYDLN